MMLILKKKEKTNQNYDSILSRKNGRKNEADQILGFPFKFELLRVGLGMPVDGWKPKGITQRVHLESRDPLCFCFFDKNPKLCIVSCIS